MKVGTDPPGNLLGGEQSGWFHDRPFAMHPFGFNGIQPRAFDGEKADDDANTVAVVLHDTIVGMNPGANLFADMPGGIVPDQEEHPLTLVRQVLADPVEKLLRNRTDGATVNEAEQQRVCLGGHVICRTEIDAITGEGFRMRIAVGNSPFDEMQRVIRRGKRMQMRQRLPTPPHLIGKAYRPIGLCFSECEQAVSSVFFRV